METSSNTASQRQDPEETPGKEPGSERSEKPGKGIDSAWDIVIIGGGLVGASLAIALKPAGKQVLLVETVEHQSSQQPSYDERTVALTHSARMIFSAIGIWNQIKDIQAQPILDIHISNRGHFGQTHLSHKDVGTDALGYVVPTRVIGEVLWKDLEKDRNTTVFCPASACRLEQHRDYCMVEINHGNQVRRVKSHLVVLADGGRSPLNNQFSESMGGQPETTNYPNSAILSIVTTDRPHHGRAYERFTDEGPLALLPHSNIRGHSNDSATYALVWSTSVHNLERRMALPDEDFLASLQRTFGDRAGNFSNPSPRKSYPLKRSTLPQPADGRVVVIGNAAHTVHPVAGQGFNLGLRDVATLAELIYTRPELGDSEMISAYNALRKRDTAMVSRFTHTLIEVFSSDLKSITLLRNLGLNAIEHFPPAKRFFLKRTMGLAAKQSKLALGIPLVD